MKTLILTSLIGAMAVAAAGPGAAADKKMSKSPPMAAGQCFRTRDIENHSFADSKTMYMKVGGKGVYRVIMSNSCLGGHDSTDPLVIKETGGSGVVCAPIDFDVSVHSSGSGIQSQCIVSQIAKLSPAEVEAVPKKLRP